MKILLTGATVYLGKLCRHQLLKNFCSKPVLGMLYTSMESITKKTDKLDFMAFYQFRKKQIIKASLEEVWAFISSPENLKKITPEYMNFRITSIEIPVKMHEGMIRSYRVNPLPMISTTWVTEITNVVDKKYFVDEQRVGPYTMWHHEHILEPVENGILMTDIVSYVPPFGIFGAIINKLVIKKQLETIFKHRIEAINRVFNSNQLKLK